MSNNKNTWHICLKHPSTNSKYADGCGFSAKSLGECTVADFKSTSPLIWIWIMPALFGMAEWKCPTLGTFTHPVSGWPSVFHHFYKRLFTPLSPLSATEEIRHFCSLEIV